MARSNPAKGKIFEEAVAKQAEVFELQGRFMMFRIPDPLKYTKHGIRKDKATFADFAGCVRGGQFFGMDVKTTHKAASFELSLVRPIQRDRLAAVTRFGGIAFLFVRREQKAGTKRRADMSSNFEFYAFPVAASGVIGGESQKSSIKWTEAKERGYQLQDFTAWGDYIVERAEALS